MNTGKQATMGLNRLVPKETTVWMILCFVLSVLLSRVQTSCTFPTALQARWLRARDNVVLEFNLTAVSGHTITVGSTTISSFKCYSVTGDKYTVESPIEAETGGGFKPIPYICWEMVKITDFTYFFYELTPDYPSATVDERIVDQNSIPSPGACTETNQEPTILYKLSGGASTVDLATVSSAALTCPSDVFNTYSYAKDGTNCAGSELDFCADRTKAQVNYTTCATEIMYSSGGKLTCLTGSFNFGSGDFFFLINQDTGLADPSHRFVCVKLVSSTAFTVYPTVCSGGTSQSLSLTVTNACPITTSTVPPSTTAESSTAEDSSTDSSTSASSLTSLSETTPSGGTTASGGGGGGDDGGGNGDVAPIAAGVSIGLIVIIAGVVVGVICYRRFKKKRAITPSKPTNGHAHTPVDEPHPTAAEAPPEKTPPTDETPKPPAHLPPLNGDVTPRTESLRS